jgi:gliding motility-associated-like protein
MKLNLKLIVLCTFIIAAVGQIAAQNKQYNQWRFGLSGGGLDFNTNPPTFVTSSAIQANEGSASVADRISGALLFYTDGVRVWNSQNQIMPNGNGLQGGTPALLTSSTAAVIIPKPRSCHLYYIITVDEGVSGASNTGIKYSVVDMNLDGGLGDVIATQKNIPLLATSTEKLEVVPAANGTDFWIVTHNNSTFYSFLLNSGGIALSPMVSPLSVPFPNAAGHLKVNRQFNLLASGSGALGKVNLFSFNNSTGAVSDLLQWDLEPAMMVPVVYGVEFSPNGSFLYIANVSQIMQYNIEMLDTTAIRNSAYLVVPQNPLFGALQLGSDDKIYVRSANPSIIGNLSTIVNPNLAGSACNYQVAYIQNQSANLGLGLPKWVYPTSGAVNVAPLVVSTCGDYTSPWGTVYSQSGSYSDTLETPNGCDSILSVDLTVSAALQVEITTQESACDTASGSATVVVTGGLPQYAYSWSSGSENTSTINDLPPGEITVTVTDSVGCTGSATSVITLADAPEITISADDVTLTAGDSVLLNVAGALSYQWSPAISLSCSDCAAPWASPTETTTYFVTGTDAAGCVATDTLTIVVENDIICGEVFLPTVFSPNKKGPEANETFCVFSDCVEQFKLVIHNRWGERVFETEDVSRCWDGIFKENEAATGVYGFNLYIRQLDGTVINKTGTLTLVR